MGTSLVNIECKNMYGNKRLVSCLGSVAHLAGRNGVCCGRAAFDITFPA